MTDPDGPRPGSPGPGSTGPGSTAGNSWEQRAAGLASEIQRWLIRTSARSMRDQVGGQVKKALRGPEPRAGDAWSTATTEPPYAADEAPECAWCPVCRAARRISQSRTAAEGRGPKLSDAADVMAAAVRDALAGLDAILSYRPPAEQSADQPQPADEALRHQAQEEGPTGTASPDARADRTEEPEDEPGHRG